MNFGGDEVVYDYAESGIVIVPVPYDETSTWMKGADKGPDAIMDASVNLEFYDIETETEAHLKGIYTLDPVLQKETPGRLVEDVYYRILTLLSDNKFPVIVGGNHTVSIGAIKAFSEYYEDISVLQIDAHADLRPIYAQLVQVGIRSMSADELPYADKDRIFFSHKLYYDKSLYKKAIDLLSENVYITIDLDAFDPSIMPSTGTPEPGGPSYYELLHFMRDVIKTRNVVGFDIVELCPSETNKSPDFIAAKIIYQLLSYRFGK
jgi:agmatinase